MSPSPPGRAIGSLPISCVVITRDAGVRLAATLESAEACAERLVLDSGSTDAAPLRRLANGTDMLSYALFQDSGRSTVWGNTGGTGAGYTASSAAPTDVTVYGRIAASQSVPAASYSDTVVATITF